MAFVPPLIVTGMARSGTSAATRLLQSAGLHVGDELIPASDDNKVGFYEDVSFVEFNQEAIAAGLAAEPDLRPRWMYAERIDRSLLEPLQGRAREMIESRAALGRPWGFKDPRTAALLDFWDEAAPGARYVFVYRPPWDVVDSMFRLSRRPLAGHADLAARTWVTYNRAILDFMARNRHRCALVHAAALGGAAERVVGRTNALLRDAGSPELSAPAPDAVDPELLVALPEASSLAEVLRAGFPEVETVYAELEREADLPASAAAPAGPRVAELRVASNGAGGELPVDLVVVARGGEAPGVARRELLVAPEPSAGAAANAGVTAAEADVVAVAFGAAPRADLLAAAATAVEEREGRAAAIGSGVLSPETAGTIYPGELLEETFRPHAIVLRRSTWQALGGFDESVPAGGLDAWAAAVALVDAGVPIVPVVEERPAADGAPLPGAHEHARQHVAVRHAELFAQHAAHVRERAAERIEDLERQRDHALELRDHHEAAAADAQRRVEDAEARAAAGAEAAGTERRRADAAERRAGEAERRAGEAERRAGEAELRAAEAAEALRAATAERDELARQLASVRETRVHRLGRAWWRLRERVRRPGG